MGKQELWGPTKGRFKWGARLDWTLVSHVTGAFLLCYIHPYLSIAVAIYLEVMDGLHSAQGADVLDLAADGYGIWFWYAISGETLIKIV
jgi:hypothetical protein